MNTLTCQQFEQAYNAVKTSQVSHVTWRQLSYTLVTSFEIDISQVTKVVNASKTFLREREALKKREKQFRTFSPEELQNILVELDNEDDDDSYCLSTNKVKMTFIP